MISNALVLFPELVCKKIRHLSSFYNWFGDSGLHILPTIYRFLLLINLKSYLLTT